MKEFRIEGKVLVLDQANLINIKGPVTIKKIESTLVKTFTEADFIFFDLGQGIFQIIKDRSGQFTKNRKRKS